MKARGLKFYRRCLEWVIVRESQRQLVLEVLVARPARALDGPPPRKKMLSPSGNAEMPLSALVIRLINSLCNLFVRTSRFEGDHGNRVSRLFASRGLARSVAGAVFYSIVAFESGRVVSPPRDRSGIRVSAIARVRLRARRPSDRRRRVHAHDVSRGEARSVNARPDDDGDGDDDDDDVKRPTARWRMRSYSLAHPRPRSTRRRRAHDTRRRVVTRRLRRRLRRQSWTSPRADGGLVCRFAPRSNAACERVMN